MSKNTRAYSTHESPNSIPLGKRQNSPSPSPLQPAMYQDNHYLPVRGRSRSPQRPVSNIKIYEDAENREVAVNGVTQGEVRAEEWAVDKENLYNQIEKLTLRLDTAHVLANSQKDRIADLEKLLQDKVTLAEVYQQRVQDKTKLVDVYQKRWREDAKEKENAHKKTDAALDKCILYKAELVTLSHQLRALQKASG